MSGNAPTWAASDSSDIYWYAANYGDGSYAPKLTLVYDSGQDSVNQSIIGNKVSLEALRNLEMEYGGRNYIGKTGLWVYESRYHRNV